MATVTALSLSLSLSVSLVYRRQVSFCTASLQRTIHVLTKTSSDVRYQDEELYEPRPGLTGPTPKR